MIAFKVDEKPISRILSASSKTENPKIHITLMQIVDKWGRETRKDVNNELWIIGEG
jgi:hypothetical protein